MLDSLKTAFAMRRNVTDLSVVLPLLTALAACDGGDPAAPPVDLPPAPAALEVVAPSEAIAGDSFTVVVRALDVSGAVDREWSGDVALEASAGTVEPDSVRLTAGEAEARVVIDGHAGALTLLARQGSTLGTTSLELLGRGAPVRLEIVPGAVLLPGEGESHALAVRARDAEGAPVVVDVAWSSSDPATVSVSAGGVLTALTSVGSAAITATADGVESAPIVALVAEPAENALLVPDAQVTGGPEAQDPPEAYGPGWRYRVRLQGVEGLEEGRLLLGTGETPLAGRIVELVEVEGDEVEVGLELVALADLFQALEIDETLLLGAADVDLSPDASRDYRLQMLPGGALRATPRSDLVYEPEEVTPTLQGTEFSLGPFECKADVENPGFDIAAPEYEIVPNLSLAIAYNDGLERLAVVGALRATFSMRPVFKVAVKGTVECSAEIITITLPIGGPLALFIGGQVPIGVGVDMSAELSLGDVGMDIEAEAGVELELGVDCPGGACALVQTFDSGAEGRFEFIHPTGSEDLRAELSGYGHAFAALSLGARFSHNLQLELVKATAGLEQAVDLATVEGQVEDPEYASSFRLLARADVGPGSALERALSLLGIDAASATFEFADTLARSPRGTLSAEPNNIVKTADGEAGDSVTFTVELDPTTYLTAYAVEGVSLYWNRVTEAGDTIFEAAPGACETMTAAAGQTNFTCRTDLPGAAEGTHRFHAFVHSLLFGAPIPVPLEIAEEGVADVTVGGDGAATLLDHRFETIASVRGTFGGCEYVDSQLRQEELISFADTISAAGTCVDTTHDNEMSGEATHVQSVDYDLFDGQIRRISSTIRGWADAMSEKAVVDPERYLVAAGVATAQLRLDLAETVAVTLRATCSTRGETAIPTLPAHQINIHVYSNSGEEMLAFACDGGAGSIEESMVVAPGILAVATTVVTRAAAPSLQTGTSNAVEGEVDYSVEIEP